MYRVRYTCYAFVALDSLTVNETQNKMNRSKIYGNHFQFLFIVFLSWFSLWIIIFLCIIFICKMVSLTIDDISTNMESHGPMNMESSTPNPDPKFDLFPFIVFNKFK